MKNPIVQATPRQAVAPAAPIRHRRALRKVLLIQPPAFCNNQRSDMNPNPPLGIAYIGATLERAGYQVKILDAFIEGWEINTRISPEKLLVGLPYERIKDIIAAENPDVVGVTSMFTSQRKNAHRVAQLAKEVDPEIVTILGGAHPTAAPESVLADANVDAVVLGEGDNAIVPLLQCLEQGGDLSVLDGIGYRDAGGNPVTLEKTNQIPDLDLLPFPARHLLPMEKYFASGVRHGGYSRGRRAASMITSRGCQYYCNFCTAFKVFTRTPRMRSVENVLAEIEELVTRYGVDEIFFEDDQLIAKQRRTGDLFDAIAKKFKVKWDTPNGVSPWLLDEEIVAKMKAAGCYRVNLAIESGNQWVLKNIINKPVKLDQIPALAKLIRKHGMNVGTFIVIGNIGKGGVETIAQIKDSFAFCRKIRVFPHVSLLTAYPGAEVLEIAKEKGYLVPGFDWDDLSIQKAQIQTPQWTPQQLLALVERERLKTRWWLMVTSPLKSVSTIWNLLVKEPVLTLKRTTHFLRTSVQRAVS